MRRDRPGDEGAPMSAASTDKTTRYGAVAILWAFLFPPAGMIYAYRCLREAGKHNNAKTLGYVACGFVAGGLVVYSLIFAAVTRDIPLIVNV
jgi:hypothetical protein